ncbi:dihydrodipicolinate synthase family protein [Sediminibacillus massiliensis]|uniref:dihydrodipicolinate synthase family protein n=1 Tax=Sediminibacillus massiliensis TaxID=1926277 RepID=UPI0009888FA4|nr:dihydrodipicolinate synthase family protein [Sediminibacillus massiliensis]
MYPFTRFKGIIPPVSTIVNDEGTLEKEQMGQLIDHLIEAGVDGLFFLGTGGEFSQMSVQEREKVASFAVNYINKRVPVLIGTGSTSTRESVRLSQHAERVGADGIVVINPFYWNLTEENLLNYYKQVSDSVNLPIILYNFPNLTGQDLTPELVLKIADQNENIVGIKDTVDSIGHIREVITKVKGKHPHFSVFCGFDDHLFNTLQLGGDGAISASANFAPQLSIGIYEACQNGDLSKAAELHRKLAILPSLYKLDSPFVNVVKEATKMCGINVSTEVLAPSQKLREEKLKQMRGILEIAEVLPKESTTGEQSYFDQLRRQKVQKHFH